jgi:DNA-binding MarR family transcriptional regulator
MVANFPLPAPVTGLRRSAVSTPLRREEVLAFIVERLARGRGCPSYKEIGEEVGVSQTRARQLVDQLVNAKVLERTAGLQRNLVVRDVTHAREIVVEVFRRIGGMAAAPLGDLVGHCAQAQLPIVAVLEHIPNHDGDRSAAT